MQATSSVQRLLRGLVIGALFLGLVRTLRAETQTFSLAAQWNLITFQVTPDNANPEALFATLPGFQSAWTYDAASGLWLRFVKLNGSPTQQTNDSVANQLFALPFIEPGRAYWIQMANAVSSWAVPGTVPKGLAFPSLTLNPGWNLIGIPVGAASVSNSEPVSLLAVLTAAGFDYDALLTWENQSFRKMFRPQGDAADLATNVLAGLPPDPPFPSFDLQRDLGRGYWIHVLDPAVLRPRLVTTVRPDIDADPLNNFPSKEDLNVSGGSGGSVPKTVQDQDVIRFFPGEDVQTLGVANLGGAEGNGGGILLWEAVWIPLTDRHTKEPWIRLFASPDQREQRDQQGQLLSAYTNLTGVTTLENDIVYLRLDRKSLGRGVHQGDLILRTSVGDRTFHVVAEVPGLEGDFKGFAQITSVSGKRNPVPDIDLNISLYEDIRVGGLLRGLIDSSQALLWPVDVPLVGHRVSDVGNQFIMGGAFVLPPGDQNGEPFDRWDENDPTAGNDVDWLNDGVLDVRNPFPFPIQRTVSLEGELVRGNPTDGYVLEGKYNEIVYGMSRQPIVLEGTFHLERQAARPLSSRRSIASDTGVEPVLAKKNNVAVAIPVGASRESSLTVATEMELQALQVELVFTASLPHSSLLIQLRSPGPNPVVLTLYDGRAASAAINPKVLEHITFPLDRPTQGDLNQFLRSIRRTRTDSSQFWTLIIANTGSRTVTLANWTLRLEGQPVTDVVGVVTDGGKPVSGVVVSLNGVPFSMSSAPTDAEGRFILSRVPLLPLNFSGSRPGYLPLDPNDPGLSANFTRPFVAQAGLTFSALEMSMISHFNPLPGAPPAGAGVAGFSAGTTNLPFELQMRSQPTGPPTIIAGPRWMVAGGTVDFVAVNTSGVVSWDFGDGSFGGDASLGHSYQTPGLYHVRLFSPTNQPTPVATVDIVVAAAPGHVPARPSDLAGEPSGLPAQTAGAAYVAYAFQPVFTFAGVVPAHKVGVDPNTGADRYISDVTPQSVFTVGETNEFGAAFVAAMPMQQAYPASMDTDLAPHTSPAQTSRPFNSDGFVPLSSPGFDPSINSNNQGFREEDFNYAHLAVLWENTRAADGTLEYLQDAQSGLIVWGNTLLDPNVNYSAQTFEASDGTDFSWVLDDAVFHPHQGATVLPDLSTSQIVTHLRMVCSMGAPLLAAPIPATSVKVAKLRRSQPDNPLDPDLLTAPSPVSRNLDYQLLIGVLATP
ncbi:MAG TPA: PKD domain-containing protein [Verrucomicrobiae bacterium]|nr:PKD domain-containing protein [Verrucomicrobiae bacterium]